MPPEVWTAIRNVPPFLTFTPDDEGVYQVDVVAKDKDKISVLQSRLLTVDGAAPTVTSVRALTSVTPAPATMVIALAVPMPVITDLTGMAAALLGLETAWAGWLSRRSAAAS